MRYDAVIFDLFGTLVPSMDEGAYRDSLRRTALVVGADPDAFLQLWTDQDRHDRRMIGRYATQADCIQDVCLALAIVPNAAGIEAAARIRREFERSLLIPRPDALATLAAVRERGLKVGLMCACSADAPALWPKTPFPPCFDAALFSHREGVTKPDARFYALACTRLRVAADRCLYVGDGAGRELTGATKAGMRAVLICPPDEEAIVMKHSDAQEWRGPRVAALTEVLEHLKGEHNAD